MKRWLFLDTNFLAWWQYYGAARREPRAAIPGVVSYVRGLWKTFGPHETVWMFDRGPYHRATAYPGYKAKRLKRNVDESTAAAEEELRADVDRFRMSELETLGYGNVYSRAGYEADDMMAAVARLIPDTDTITMISGDHDLYQCLSRRVSVFHPVREQMVDYRGFRDVYGIHPTQWAEVKAVAGCTSDNITGVDGVAEKTALKYVRGEPLTPRIRAAIRDFVDAGGVDFNRTLIELPWGGLQLDDPPQPEPAADLARYHRWCRGRGIHALDSRRVTRAVDEPDLFSDVGA